MLLPASYVRPGERAPEFVQLSDVADLLNELTARYQRFGGYTLSNPFAPPPFSGGYQGGPQERTFLVIVIVPDNFLNEAQRDIERLVELFQERYYQTEILCCSYPVRRHVPRRASPIGEG